MGLIPTSKDDFTEEILFFLLAQLASLSSASSSFYSTSFLFFSFFFSSFACHIFKEASPCQNCQLLLHKLCPSQIWQKIEKDSRFWNVMHQCIIRLNSWHTNLIDRYLHFYDVWMLDFVYFMKVVFTYVHLKRGRYTGHTLSAKNTKKITPQSILVMHSFDVPSQMTSLSK